MDRLPNGAPFDDQGRSILPEAGDRAKRKAGRLGNDRPSLGARLGVGYRSLGVCGKGASMSGLGSRRRTIWNSCQLELTSIF